MKWAFWIFTGLYAAALLIHLIGTYGWFGEEKDPLSGAFLIVLGFPWVMFTNSFGIAGKVAGMLAPAINASILFWLWKR